MPPIESKSDILDNIVDDIDDLDTLDQSLSDDEEEIESQNSSLSNDGKLIERTAICWDWDDTLLCSSFLSSEGYRLDTEEDKTIEMRKQLKQLEQTVINVLKLSLQYGAVHIITNAETGWVQLSAQKFIPGVVPLLEKVNILSARSTFEPQYPDSPLKWKFYAFQQRLHNILSEQNSCKNILSFGDSHVEREAVRAVTRDALQTRTKSVKFAERPSIEQLQRQIELVTNCFQYIHCHQGDLDLCMSLSVTNNDEQQQQQQQQQKQQQQQQQQQQPVHVQQ